MKLVETDKPAEIAALEGTVKFQDGTGTIKFLPNHIVVTIDNVDADCDVKAMDGGVKIPKMSVASGYLKCDLKKLRLGRFRIPKPDALDFIVGGSMNLHSVCGTVSCDKQKVSLETTLAVQFDLKINNCCVPELHGTGDISNADIDVKCLRKNGDIRPFVSKQVKKKILDSLGKK